jgi:branched-chain amino acid transport system ATP-binding protein
VTALLTITNLSHRFGDLAALDGIDLRVAEGDRHAIVGANGAGKTTLLALIAGTVRPPTAGRIELAGRDITRVGPAGRARAGIARTFQTPQLIGSRSALDNLVLAAWRHSARGAGWSRGRYRRLADRGREALDELGLAGRAEQPANTLAHGQRRLLELGVALAARPWLLLLDEPAAGLTAHDREQLVFALRRLPQPVAVLLVDHDLPLAAALDPTVTVLQDGRAVMTGPARQVLDDPAFRHAYLRTATAVT